VIAALVGLGAFLLFVVQLLLGKRLLPWFGGGSAVWTTCLVFYQLALLAGYAWAHGLARLAPRRQRDLHLALLAAGVALLVWRAFAWPSPITPDGRPAGLAVAAPIRSILSLLGSSIGLQFVALSAGSPLLQAWYARLRPGASPYRLFALSNAGSLAGLIGYPLVIERASGVVAQGWLWSAAFAVYALAVGGCALGAARTGRLDPNPAAEPALPSSPAHDARAALVCLALACFPSLSLAAVTSHLTQEVAAVPLLWMLPLALYLLSFVVAFAWPDRGRVLTPVALAAAACLALAGLHWALELKPLHRIVLWASVLFVYCTAGHGELARRRPEPTGLTRYYLLIAAGGALGGLFAALVAPLVFTGYVELHLALLVGPLALAAARLSDREPPEREPAPARIQRAALVLACLAALAAGLALDVAGDRHSLVRASRGFHGVLRVVREEAGQPDEHLTLLNGRIAHGLQLTSHARRSEPTTYFGPESGVGLAIRRHPKRLAGSPMRVGVIGLGVGTLAAWSRPGDSFRFYELDPQVASLSAGDAAFFTYLRDARGQSTVTLGDARLALESEPPEAYDVLVLDAFSSDAIPVHLLTLEAFEVYLRHLAPGGVLAVHVTNRHLDLKPVVRGAASRLGLQAEHVPSILNGFAWGADWMLLARERTLLADELVSAASLPRLPGARTLVWTDAWSDLVSVLKR
jgi:hypothetical protein